MQIKEFSDDGSAPKDQGAAPAPGSSVVVAVPQPTVIVTKDKVKPLVKPADEQYTVSGGARHWLGMGMLLAGRAPPRDHGLAASCVMA